MKHVEAVIFDWAGTMIDHGSLAPVRAVTEILAGRGIEVTDAEVRADMGLFKKDHIRNLLKTPRVLALWQAKFGSAPAESDVEDLFQYFIPAQMKVLQIYSELIPGAAELSIQLREQGLRVGSTTGYTRPMLEIIEAAARLQGYAPERSYCPDDTGGGRPNPWMCLRLACDFRLTSMASAVKVGDTPSDIDEARNAGMWSVAVAETGNEIGIGEAEFAALPMSDREQRLLIARKRLQDAGAHFVIDSVRDLPSVLVRINALLAEGKRP